MKPLVWVGPGIYYHVLSDSVRDDRGHPYKTCQRCWKNVDPQRESEQCRWRPKE